jgi:5-methylcytosine-specific restriction protein A
MAIRMCKYPGCAGLCEPGGGGMCSRHQDFAKMAGAQANLLNPDSQNTEPRLYDCQAWRKARRFFLRENPICRHCGGLARVVDHIKPHRGDYGLFWDQSNWQPLCISCHNIKTNEEKAENFKS